MEAFFVSVNYPAILVAALVNFLFGWIWFGPVFGAIWVKAGGGELKPGPVNISLGFVAALVLSYILAHSLVFAFGFLGISGPLAGLEVGFANWLGFIAPITFGPVIYERKPIKLWLLNNSYWLASLLAMGLILSIWK